MPSEKPKPDAAAIAAPACLTIAELVRRWRTTPYTIRKAIRRGDLQAFRVGSRTLRIALSEIERYEAQKPRAA